MRDLPKAPPEPADALATPAAGRAPSVDDRVAGQSRLVRLWLNGRPETTVRVYLGALDALARQLGPKPLDAVTLDDLVDHVRAMTAAGLAPATVAKRVCAIKSLFGFAHKTGFMPFDPARALRVPKRPNDLADRILERDQVERIVAAEPDPVRQLLLMLFYATGGRLSAVVALRWEHCHAHGDAGVLRFARVKGGDSHNVHLDRPVWRELVRFRPPTNRGCVFPSARRADRPVNPATAWRWVKKAGKRLGFERLSPHWFRHAHASHALDAGAPVHLVASTLGHASLATTSRYAHARPGESSGRYLGLNELVSHLAPAPPAQLQIASDSSAGGSVGAGPGAAPGE